MLSLFLSAASGEYHSLPGSRSTGFEVQEKVFGWFSGLTAAFGHGPTTVYWF